MGKTDVADHKLLAARLYTPAAHATMALDKISVRGLVLDCNIGVFEEEKLGTQRVRFTVEVSVHPSAQPLADDVSHIVNYDMIVVAIHKVIAGGHINLLETLAERVAQECLSEPRAAKVRVLVEKLDRLEEASLGVEIERVQLPRYAPNIHVLRRGDTDTNPHE